MANAERAKITAEVIDPNISAAELTKRKARLEGALEETDSFL